MRRARQLWTLSISLVIGVTSSHAFAQDTSDADAAAPDTEARPRANTEADTRHNTEEPKEAEKPAAPAPATVAATPTPEPANVVAPVRPKAGDVSVSGYFRGGFGATVQERVGVPGYQDQSVGHTKKVGGRMT